MESSLPAKASAFVIVRRPGGAVLCTLETHDEQEVAGVPGGKWEPEVDGPSWERLAAREFEEEVGAPIPPAARAGYVEWGSDAYRIRFKVLLVSEEAAEAIPTGPVSDPGGAVREVCWVSPGALANLRPHVAAAFQILRIPLVARDTVHVMLRSRTQK